MLLILDLVRIKKINCNKIKSKVKCFYGCVAQWTRARGYEPRCRGFESLLARLLKHINQIDY